MQTGTRTLAELRPPIYQGAIHVAHEQLRHDAWYSVPEARFMHRDELDEYAFAGFTIVRLIEIDAWDDNEGMAKRVLSLCPCIAVPCPDVWTHGWSKDARAELILAAATFGCTAEQADDLRVAANVAQQRGEIVEWTLVQKPEAVTALKRHLPESRGLFVVGVGLHHSDLHLLAEEYTQMAPGPSLSNVLAAKNGFPDSGDPLGFELVNTEPNSLHAHSWVCSGTDQTARANGYDTTDLNLLPQHDDAARLAAELTRGEHPAEPGLWLPWLLVDYTPTFLKT